MGMRSRRDPAGHKARGKGHPTAPAGAPEEVELPTMAVALLVEQIKVTVGTTPAVEGKLLTLEQNAAGGGCVLSSFPVDVWPAIREQVDAAYEHAGGKALDQDRERADAAGIKLASGADDIRSAAAAADELRGGSST